MGRFSFVSQWVSASFWISLAANGNRPNSKQNMSRHMGKQTICIGENIGADQLRGNQNLKLLALFCACTGRFVSDLFGNHIVGFPTRRLIYYSACLTINSLQKNIPEFHVLCCLMPERQEIKHVHVMYTPMNPTFM